MSDRFTTMYFAFVAFIFTTLGIAIWIDQSNKRKDACIEKHLQHGTPILEADRACR